MKADRILIEPFEFDTLKELNIIKEVNNHAVALISGILNQNMDIDIVKRFTPDEIITIKVCSSEGEERTLFKGLISKLSLKVENGLKIIKVWAYSHTYLLDKKKTTRVFQDTDKTFWDVAKYIGNKNHARVIGTEGKEEKTGHMMVQYQETDWEF